MDVYITKECSRLARKAKVTDDKLCEAVHRAEQGLIDAALGSGVIKQRIAGQTGGRSGGNRSILLHVEGKRAVFMDLFKKNKTDSLTDVEEEAARAYGKEARKLTKVQLGRLVKERGWRKLDYEKYQEDVSK